MIDAMRTYKIAHDFGAAESLAGFPEFLSEYERNGYDISDVTDSIVIGQQPEFLLAKLQ